MKRMRRKTFLDLVQENKELLLRDSDELEKIEDRLEQKHMRRL